MVAVLASHVHKQRESTTHELTSLQAANHVFWYSHPLTLIHWHRLWHRLSLLAWLRARCWCLNQGFARATRRLRQRADLRNGLHAPRPRAAQREASALKRRMACASCAASSGVANHSRRRSVVESVSRAGFQEAQPTCSSDGPGWDYTYPRLRLAMGRRPEAVAAEFSV